MWLQFLPAALCREGVQGALQHLLFLPVDDDIPVFLDGELRMAVGVQVGDLCLQHLLAYQLIPYPYVHHGWLRGHFFCGIRIACSWPGAGAVSGRLSSYCTVAAKKATLHAPLLSAVLAYMERYVQLDPGRWQGVCALDPAVKVVAQDEGCFFHLIHVRIAVVFASESPPSADTPR